MCEHSQIIYFFLPFALPLVAVAFVETLAALDDCFEDPLLPFTPSNCLFCRVLVIEGSYQ